MKTGKTKRLATVRFDETFGSFRGSASLTNICDKTATLRYSQNGRIKRQRQLHFIPDLSLTHPNLQWKHWVLHVFDQLGVLKSELLTVQEEALKRVQRGDLPIWRQVLFIPLFSPETFSQTWGSELAFESKFELRRDRGQAVCFYRTEARVLDYFGPDALSWVLGVSQGHTGGMTLDTQVDCWSKASMQDVSFALFLGRADKCPSLNDALSCLNDKGRGQLRRFFLGLPAEVVLADFNHDYTLN